MNKPLLDLNTFKTLKVIRSMTQQTAYRKTGKNKILKCIEESNTDERKNKMIIKKQSFSDLYKFKTRKVIGSVTTDCFQKTWEEKIVLDCITSNQFELNKGEM